MEWYRMTDIKRMYGRESQLLSKMHKEMLNAKDDKTFFEKSARFYGAKRMMEETIKAQTGEDIVLIVDNEVSLYNHGEKI